MNYQIKRHVTKKQIYYPENKETIYRFDEFCKLEVGKRIIDSNMMRIVINEIIPAPDDGMPSILINMQRYQQEEYDKEARKYNYSFHEEDKLIKPGESVHYADAGQNCSDYFVQYSFDISVAEGEYIEDKD